MKAVWSIWLALCLFAAGGEAWAQIGDVNAAINKAGRQRMLSQRMAKAYFQLGLQVEVERSRRILDSSVALFDRQLAELKSYAPTPEIRESFGKLEKSWVTYKAALTAAPPNPPDGRRVLALSEEVLLLAQQGTQQLEEHAGTPAGHLVNLAGRQRMLSQRMAKFYQALTWGIGDAAGSAELERARREFGSALQELSGAPNNAPPIREGLELVKQQWFFFENALDQRGTADKRPATAVATSSERILEEMEGVVALYEKNPHK